jgi:hypothetical protein
MKRLTACALLLASLTTVPWSASADILKQKQEAKKVSKWSLSEWLSTKNNMKLMDFWLALHSPSPFEFELAGDYMWAGFGGVNSTGYGFQVAAFASIFGLEFQWEQVDLLRMHGIFHFRFFGLHDQGTNMTLNLGLRSQNEGGGYRNFFLGGSLTLYVGSFFGIEGLYQYYFDAQAANGTLTVSGMRYHAGAFIEFGFFRVFGRFFFETDWKTQGGLPSSYSRSGSMLGAKIFL